MKKSLCILILYVLTISGQAQMQNNFEFHYTYQIPSKEIKKRFGNNSSIGASYIMKNQKNILYGMEFNYLFSDNVKDTLIFENITTEEGGLLDANGSFANFILLQRGFDIYLLSGYAFLKDKKNLSGLYVTGGLGFIQHKIFIDTKNQNLPQLNEEYKKGYDRMTNGFSSKLSIDYKYYSKKEFFQFTTGISLVTAFTKIRRPYLIDQKTFSSKDLGIDQLFGIKAGFIIPINRSNKEEFYYY